MKRIIVILAFLALAGCGHNNATDSRVANMNFCGSIVEVRVSGTDVENVGIFPATLVETVPSNAFKKFCTLNSDSSVAPWRGGYRSISKLNCGFWGDPVTSGQELSLGSNQVDCD